MSTLNEAAAAAATFAHRDRAQSLNAVKAVIEAAKMWGPAAIVPPQTLSISDLKSVVEQAESARAELAAERDLNAATQESAQREVVAHFDTMKERDALKAELAASEDLATALQASLHASQLAHHETAYSLGLTSNELVAAESERDRLREALATFRQCKRRECGVECYPCEAVLGAALAATPEAKRELVRVEYPNGGALEYLKEKP